MKKTLKVLVVLSAATILVISSIQAQPRYGQQFYLEREKKASPQIKALLVRLRAEKEAKHLKFTPAYTQSLDRNLATITGAVLPSNFRQQVIDQNRKAKIVLDRLKQQALTNRNVHFPFMERTKAHPGYVGQRHFDWRSMGVSTPVEDQGQCGTCWDFCACSAFEECWKLVNMQVIAVSEQNVMDCNSGGKDCGGGWPSNAFDYIQNSGVATALDDPYVGRRITPCNNSLSKPYKAEIWGYVGSDDGIPSIEQMKADLIAFGPLAIGVNATDLFKSFASNPGEVFNEGASGDVNHCVTLIGWDDDMQAWLLKNSWGPGGWGQDGYGWVSYFTNNVGKGAAWVLPQAVGVTSQIGTTTYTINPPIVNRKDAIYDGHNAAPIIQFKAGDRVEVDVRGCVQTGGTGKTWKRYVNPLGNESDKFYFGQILIPGQSTVTAFRNLPGGKQDPSRPDSWTFNFTVAAGITDQQSYLHLSYTDDNYGDNGYWGHDDGNEDQCKNVGPAIVIVKITR